MYKRYFLLFCYIAFLCYFSHVVISQEQNVYTIAVLDLEPIGVSQVEARVLSDKLRSDITQIVNSNKYIKAGIAKYKVIERTQIEKIFDQYNIQNTGCVSDSCAIEFGKMLQVDRIVIGSLGLVGNTYLVTPRIVNVETGNTVGSTSQQVRGTIDDVVNLIKIVANELLFNNENVLNLEKEKTETKKLPIEEKKEKTSIFQVKKSDYKVKKIITSNAEISIQSKYVWRGLPLTDGPVLQPSVTLGLKGISLNLWGNMDITDANELDKNDAFDINEIDYTLSYSKSLAGLDYSVGVIHYTFPSINYDGTTEIFVGACASVLGHPSITLYKDVDQADGLYGSIGASQNIPVGLLFGLEVSAAIGFGSKGYNEFYFNQDDFALNDVMIGLGIPIGIGEIAHVTPAVTYTVIINSYISDILYAADIDYQNVYFGVTASVNF